ncbi:MAG TPA: hypothetical protein VG935_02090 [Patescibacteria group bacterium]|nr:hypothetical protein [Patescibacteria group bacterium]
MNLPVFLPNTIKRMREYGISESQVIDVFNHGIYKRSENGSKMAIKKFNGFEIGCFYDQNPRTTEYVITGVWRRDRA